MDEDDDMDIDHTKKPPSWDPPRRPGGDPGEPLVEDHQDPLEDAHRVDPLEADHRAGEDPLDRADPAEALLEDLLGTPTTHQGTATRKPPDSGLSTSAGGSSSSSARWTRARAR